jgi:hypothetical protein
MVIFSQYILLSQTFSNEDSSKMWDLQSMSLGKGLF